MYYNLLPYQSACHHLVCCKSQKTSIGEEKFMVGPGINPVFLVRCSFAGLIQAKYILSPIYVPTYNHTIDDQISF